MAPRSLSPNSLIGPAITRFTVILPTAGILGAILLDRASGDKLKRPLGEKTPASVDHLIETTLRLRLTSDHFSRLRGIFSWIASCEQTRSEESPLCRPELSPTEQESVRVARGLFPMVTPETDDASFIRGLAHLCFSQGYNVGNF